MEYEDLLRLYSGQGDMQAPSSFGSFGANGFDMSSLNVGQPQLAQGLLGDSQSKNQANLQNMQAITQQGLQQGMAASQNFQAGQQAQADATMNQLQQKIAQDEAQKQKMMGLALTFAMGGFGGGAEAAGAEAGTQAANAGMAAAMAGMGNLDPNKKRFF